MKIGTKKRWAIVNRNKQMCYTTMYRHKSEAEGDKGFEEHVIPVLVVPVVHSKNDKRSRKVTIPHMKAMAEIAQRS